MRDGAHVESAVEERADARELDVRSDAQIGGGLGDAARAHEGARDRAEGPLRARLRLGRRPRHGVRDHLFARAERALHDARAARAPAELGAERVVGRLDLDGALRGDVPSADDERGPLMREIGRDLQLVQLLGEPEAERVGAAAALRSRLRVERRPIHPHLSVDGARAIAQQREVALVHLRDHLVRRPVHVDVRAEAVGARDLPNDVRVAHVLERPRTPRHAQLLEPILGQDGDERRPDLGEAALEGRDLPFKERLVLDLHAQRLAEVEHLAIEVEEVHLLPDRPPVADHELAARHAGGRLVDVHRHEALAERRVVAPVDGERRPRGADLGKRAVGHGSVRPRAQRARSMMALDVDHVSRRELLRRRGVLRRRVARRVLVLLLRDDLEIVDDDGHALLTRS